jgi:hypothetical protein
MVEWLLDILDGPLHAAESSVVENSLLGEISDVGSRFLWRKPRENTHEVFRVETIEFDVETLFEFSGSGVVRMFELEELFWIW